MRAIPVLSAVALSLLLGHSVHAADAAAGEQKYQQLCATCHGAGGAGHGPAAAALRPAPRDMTDAEWQAEVDDDYIKTVTRDGGAAVGLAPTMTAFGGALSDEDLDNVVAFIRSLVD